MERNVYLILSGFLGGILAGLGMGGGTLTIPILVLALGVGQITAQAVNLIAFLPTGCVALSMHIKNGYVEFENMAFLIFPAIISCVLVSFFALNLDGSVLKKIYGVFLIAIGFASLTAKIIQIRKIGYLH